MKPLKVDKLSDEFGQYEILLKCGSCDHARKCYPNTLAAFAGWDARLDDVVKRLRCTKCDERRCTASVFRPATPRGWTKH
jgi:hypothetical protein